MEEVGTLSKNEVINKVRFFIIENFLFGNEDDMVDNVSSFMESGLIDSTGILELIEFVEENYSFDVEDNELIPENLDSLDNISSYILKKKV